MRVALITQYYPPERGAVRYGQRLANGLSARGHLVTVLAGIPHFPVGRTYSGFRWWWPDVRYESGVRVIRLPMIMGANTQTIRRVLGFLSFTFAAFSRLLFMKRQDVIIASVPPVTSSLAGILAARLRGSRLIILLRDIEPLRALSQRRKASSPGGRTAIRFFMWIYRCAERVVVVHDTEIDLLRFHQIPESRIVTITHGVDSTDPIPPTLPSIPRRVNRVLAMYVGTIGLVHGLETLIDSLTDERIQSLPIDFAILGDGQFARRCSEKVVQSDLTNVWVLPSIPLVQVGYALRQADVLICSYRNDDNVPLGSKFYEYCASGRPILVHGTNAAGELVSRIGNGIACEAGNVSELEAALKDFVARPEHWKEAGHRGRLYALEHFSQDMRDRQWDELITESEPTAEEGCDHEISASTS